MISWENFENEVRLTSGLDGYEILRNAWIERRDIIKSWHNINDDPSIYEISKLDSLWTDRTHHWSEYSTFLRGIKSIAGSIEYFITSLWFTNDGDNFFQFNTFNEICGWIENDDGMMLPGYETNDIRLLHDRDVRLLITIYRVLNKIRYITHPGEDFSSPWVADKKYARAYNAPSGITTQYSTGSLTDGGKVEYSEEEFFSSETDRKTQSRAIREATSLAKYINQYSKSERTIYFQDSALSYAEVAHSNYYMLPVYEYPVRYQGVYAPSVQKNIDIRYFKISSSNSWDESSEEVAEKIYLPDNWTYPDDYDYEWNGRKYKFFEFVMKDGSKFVFPPDPVHEIGDDLITITNQTLRAPSFSFKKIADIFSELNYSPHGYDSIASGGNTIAG